MGMECMFHRTAMEEGRSSSVLRQLSLSRVPDSSWSCSPWDEEEEKKLERQVWEWQWEWEWQRQCEVKERKKIMVVVDGSPQSRTAMLWAVSHLVNMVDTLILVHVLDSSCLRKCKPDIARRYLRACHVLNSMRSLCISRIPQVHVEGVMIQGDRATTIVSYANKLQVSLLVLGQRKPSLFHRFVRSKRQELIDFCINNAECLTLSVRRQSGNLGGYIINSRWHRDFWLLA
ncbi:hypothetical protein SUGI_0483420 [Cryptomeria japonica]|uniref:uncharacterized protein LOC131031056 n=1 Tax=Cryptomeria japonica TaxID=3369 RepID=UPI002408B2A6|nr:uncharacterized protein LOC131031056 [Cryptomeria japonica]GLJ25251.1 hypothetical protein SUGI_0483420 [Cryptomeria japonica]